MDQLKLRSLVFEKTGVRIDVDDPIFALVALNEAVLAEAVERHVALLDDATRELAVQARALQAGGKLCRFDGSAGSGGLAAPAPFDGAVSEFEAAPPPVAIKAQRAVPAAQPGGSVFTSAHGQAAPSPAFSTFSTFGTPAGARAPGAAPERPSANAVALALGAAVLGAALVLTGQALWFKPAPAPAPVVQARELTPEQSAAIKNGDKLARIVQKLDPKVRGAIQAEMQKP